MSDSKLGWWTHLTSSIAAGVPRTETPVFSGWDKAKPGSERTVEVLRHGETIISMHDITVHSTTYEFKDDST